jgi:RNA polymerase sigma factor (sigma-70 family)
MDVNWHSIVFDSSWLSQLEQLAAKRFSDVVTAEESVTYALEKLSEDNWRRLASFSGGSQPTTYLHSIALNLIEEYARKRYGRLRAPEWLKREGGPWTRIWQMLCLERQPLDYVIQVFCGYEKRDPPFVTGIARTIKARIPTCGQQIGRQSISHTDQQETDGFDVVLEEPMSLQQGIDREELEDRLLLFAELLQNSNSPSNRSMTNNTTDIPEDAGLDVGLLNTVFDIADLSEEELLILNMAYQQGLKMNVIAKALHMPGYQPGRILKKVFIRLIDALEQSGLDVDSLKDLIKEFDL